MNDIEKAAKFMGYEVSTPEPDTIAMSMPHAKGSAWVTKGVGGWVWFNPYTNKADLSDVIDELEIDIEWFPTYVKGYSFKEYGPISFKAEFANYPTKFTARAHAVMAVAVQIYDARFGKDGE